MKSKSKYFIDIVHKEITFDENNRWMLDLVNSVEFQRLNYIRQLGTSSYVFPCATHTRMAHSLGVYCLANRVINNLANYGIQIPEHDKKVLISAALLHDLGHGPNSHAFEEYTGINHEVYTKQILLDKKTQVHQVLKNNGVNPSDIVEILNGHTNYQWIGSIIESQLDVDRMDYLLRDSHYTGAVYGQISLSILIKTIDAIDNKLCFHKKGISEVENMLIGRYLMHSKIYNHKFSIGIDMTLKSILNRFKDLYKSGYQFKDQFKLINTFKPWLQDKQFTTKEFLTLDDNLFNTLVKSLSYEDDYVLKRLTNAYFRPNKISVKTLEKKSSVKKIKDDEKYFKIYYQTKKVKLYNAKEQPIYIYDDNDQKLKELSKISVIINKLQHLEWSGSFLIEINE